MNLGSVHGFVHGLVQGTYFMVHGVHHNVLLDHGGLPCVPPLGVHLIFLPQQVERVILRHFYSSSFLVRGLLHA